jgi:hypothetical protein
MPTLRLINAKVFEPCFGHTNRMLSIVSSPLTKIFKNTTDDGQMTNNKCHGQLTTFNGLVFKLKEFKYFHPEPLDHVSEVDLSQRGFSSVDLCLSLHPRLERAF